MMQDKVIEHHNQHVYHIKATQLYLTNFIFEAKRSPIVVVTVHDLTNCSIVRFFRHEACHMNFFFFQIDQIHSRTTETEAS